MIPKPLFRRYSRYGRLAARAHARGLSLVELMIAMMLGLLVVGSASAIFISNRQTYRATEGLGRVQENGRMAFEMMARDLREAGGNACGNADRAEPMKLVNVLDNPAAHWWTDWNDGIIGYEGAVPVEAPATRVAGTDVIDLMAGDSSTSATVEQHNAPGASILLGSTDHAFDRGDLAIICDWRQASLFQITNAAAGGDVLIHNRGGPVSPGNCSRGLGYANPPVCTPAGKNYQYGPNPVDAQRTASVMRFHAARWFVGTTAGGGRSLFRRAPINQGGAIVVRDQEIAQGVNDMELQYLLEGGVDYVDATAVTAANRWDEVTAVRVVLDVLSADRAGVGGAQLNRRIAHTVTLRNRME
jgi:type IV pilus assembly protein PilW